VKKTLMGLLLSLLCCRTSLRCKINEL